MLVQPQSSNKIIFFDLLLWATLAIIFPLCSGMLDAMSITKVLVYLGATYFVGSITIGKIKAIQNFSSFITTGLNIVFGSTICGLLYLFFPSNWVIYLLFAIFVLLSFKNKGSEFNINSLFNLLCFAPLFLMLFTTLELAYGTQIRLNRDDGDYFYYTAIVESLKINHNFSSAIYHQGIGINYQALGLLPAAQLAKFTQLPSQIALWGVYFKIVPIISFGVAASCIVQLFRHYFKPQISQTQTYLLHFFVVCMLLFLGPLHILNLLKRDFANTLFLGEGYVLPIGSPGFAFAMMFSSLALYFMLTIYKPNFKERIIFIALLGFIIASKIALFFPLTILLGAYALLLLFKKEFHWFYTLLFAFPVCILIYKFTLASSDSIAIMNLTTNGFYTSNLPILAHKYHISGSNTKKTIIMFFIGVFMWLNFKFFVLLSSINHFKKTNIKLVFLVIATFASFIVAVLPSFFLNVSGRDENGNFLFDGSFDMPQFIRADIYLVTIITIFFVLYFAFQYKHKIVRYLTLTVTIFWMFILSISFIKSNYKSKSTSNELWYYEVANDFNKAKPKFLVMQGSSNYSGQTLCGLGVHPWFCSGLKSDGDGYAMTKKAYKRNLLFQQLLDTTANKIKKTTTINYLKNEGVDCVVANPTSINKINAAVADSLLSKIEGTKWLYKVN